LAATAAWKVFLLYALTNGHPMRWNQLTIC
jgi:hypothetical protein